MLQEQHRIVATDRGSQQPVRVLGGRREHHAHAGGVREEHLTALAVIDRAAGEIPTDGRADHGRALEAAVGPPAQAGASKAPPLRLTPGITARTRSVPYRSCWRLSVS